MTVDTKKVIYSMIEVSKYYDKKPVLKDISLSYFYGAKIGVLGLNGAGKSTLLRIMAGVDTSFNGQIIPSKGYTIGYLEQEPELDDQKTVRDIVEQGVQDVVDLLKQYDANTMDAYFVMDFPWPTSDRDVILNGSTLVDPATGNVTVMSKIIDDPAFPPQEGLVRVPQLTQHFLLVYKDFNTTEVIFSLHLEAGGNLPAFTVNPATQSVPYHSLQALSVW